MIDEKRKPVILAVDDTAENLDVVKGILGNDYSVKAAINGKIALKIAESQLPDLILLDIMMPEMDGYEVCQKLKENQITSEIPVIFLTAKDQVTDEAKGFDLGAADYILKPVNPAILQARVSTHVALRQSMNALQDANEIISAHNERMEEELNVGRDIQMSMIPLDFPVYTEHKEFTIHGSIEPAREVGGDFYDFFFIDEERFCVCIGDVSGKGVPAALFMAVSKTMIKACAMEDVSTASILTNVNAELSVDNEQGMFVTIFLAILNIRTGEVTYTNAGHNPPFLRRNDGNVERIGERHGPIIAAMEGLTYREATLQLNAGDALLLYTDGVSEEMNESGELYGEERMIEVLANANVSDAEGIVNETVRAVTEFKGDKQQEDDITVLTLTYDTAETASENKILKEVAVNDLKEIARIIEVFEAFLGEHEVAARVVMTMGMIFDELLNNIISYGYKDEDEHQIFVRAELAEDRLIVTVTDDGIPFNPLNKATPDATLSLEDRSVGGLGIHLVRNMVDDITYQRRVDRNLLTLVKKL